MPTTALTEGPRGAWNVLSIVPDDGDYLLAARTVRVVHATADKAYIQGAFTTGDIILAAGTHRLVAGQRVRLSQEDSPAGLVPQSSNFSNGGR